MMFSVCLASFIFIMTSSFSKMPISGTHTVVGALLGAGIYGGVDSLNWKKLGKIVASWFISPALSAAIALLLMSVVSIATMNTQTLRYKTRLIYLQFIIGFAGVVIGINFYFLLAFEGDTALILPLLSVGCFIFGIILCRLIVLLNLIKNS